MTQNLNTCNKKLQHSLFCEKIKSQIKSSSPPLKFIWGSGINRKMHSEEKDSVVEIKKHFNKIID